MRAKRALLILALTSCNSPGAVIEPVYDPAVRDGGAPFFDLPFPSDLRTDAMGHPVLEGLGRARSGIARDAMTVVETERAGFSVQSPIYFRFTGALDPASLPEDASACADEASSVALIDIDPSSPERGTRLPCLVRFREESTRYWPEDVLVIRPVPGIPMHPGRRYAAVVMDSVRGAGGEAVAPNEAFRAVRAGEGELGAAQADVFDELERAGVAREHIVVASALTTSDPAPELDRARAFVLSQPLPSLRDWEVSRIHGVRVFEATFDSYELFSGEPPYSTFGEGAFRFDASGMPLDVNARPVRIGITVPDTAEPAGGYPIVLYGHGTGGDHLTHVGEEGAQLAPAGLAMLGFDAPLHGIRNPGVDVETIAVTNTVLAREMIRQSVLDLALLYRMQQEGALDVPAGVDGPSPVRFARDPELYMGHSQGSQVAGVLLGVEPGISASFVSEGGGDASITLVEIETSVGTTGACVIGTILAEQCEDMTEDHPFLTLVAQPLVDAADPLSFAHRILRERDPSWTPLSVAMTEGLEDQYTPFRTIEALASAIGLPLVAPVLSASDAYTARGTPTVDAPVQDNLTTAAGAPVTGGLMQWHGDHFVIYSIADATNRYVQFLSMAAQGSPVIVAPQ